MNTHHPDYERLRKRVGNVIWAYFAMVGPRDLDDSDVDKVTELALLAVDRALDEYRIPVITSDLRCSECGAQLDIELMHSYDYQIDRSGVQPGTVHGPAMYWNEGAIACPGCGTRLDYSEQSD